MSISHTNSIVRHCGSYHSALSAVVETSRSFWRLVFRKRQGDGKYRCIRERELTKAVKRRGIDSDTVNLIIEKLRDARVCNRDMKSGIAYIGLPALNPRIISQVLLDGVWPEPELRYFLMRNIRMRYSCKLTAITAHQLHLLANAVNKQLCSWFYYNQSSIPKSASDSQARPTLLPLLKQALLKEAVSVMESKALDDFIFLFLESCLVAGYMSPAHRWGCIDIRAAELDAEFLLSNLFGLATSIPGFDSLFGGGGICLCEDSEGGSEVRHEESDLVAGDQRRETWGRTILIKGQFATGKTMLSLQLASEVARKGGVAWLIPLEQSASEHLYSLETMGAYPPSDLVSVITKTKDLKKFLKDKYEEHKLGSLIILQDPQLGVVETLELIEEHARDLLCFPLRLIAIDPMSSVGTDRLDPRQLRHLLVEKLRSLKEQGTNLLFVAEETDSKPGEFAYEEYVSDIGIRLFIHRKHEYAQRYIEVIKSRFQREQRGQHAFSIVSGRGVSIYPSPAAVAARNRTRTVRTPNYPVAFGLADLDQHLGKGSLNAGDTIALIGPSGSFKTLLGLFFLQGTDLTNVAPQEDDQLELERASLLVAARDDKIAIEHMMTQKILHKGHSPGRRKPPLSIRVCSLPTGHVVPGYILRRIEDEFWQARLAGQRIDRVMIDNVSHWEMSCPFVREDLTFADTLVDYLRRRHVTSLFVCSPIDPTGESVLQQTIIDNADVAIELQPVEFRGAKRVSLNVLKTRYGQSPRQTLELLLEESLLRVKRSPSLLRVDNKGKASQTQVKIVLALYAETEMQYMYNERILQSVKAALSQEVNLQKQQLIFTGQAGKLSPYSAVDEMKVLQLDEFQLPQRGMSDQVGLSLHSFHEIDLPLKEMGFLPRLQKRINSLTKPGHFMAVPYFTNFGLLAYKRDQVSLDTLDSWSALAEECRRFESSTPQESLFFDFPKGTYENYNCLFLEMLLSSLPEDLARKHDLSELAKSPIFLKVLSTFHALCRRAYISRRRDRSSSSSKSGSGETILEVDSNAVVWRHWYTTLNQMLLTMDEETKSSVSISVLPGEVTIGGDWFLGLAEYSAAADAGLEIIKLLTSREAELDRLRQGVGLPTRSGFYPKPSDSSSHSMLFPLADSLDGAQSTKVVQCAFKAHHRSNFENYLSDTSILSYYLQRALEIPSTSSDLERHLAEVVRSLESCLRYNRG